MNHRARNTEPANLSMVHGIRRRKGTTTTSARRMAAAQKTRPGNTGKRWNVSQDARLCELYAHHSTQQIAQLMARTSLAIAKRLKHLGMKPTTIYSVSFRREWEECFQLQVTAHSVDEARAKAQAEAEDTSADWNNMEEIFCEPLFVDSVNVESGLSECDALWERPLTDNERLERFAPEMLTMLISNLTAWDDEEDSVRAEHAMLISSLRTLIDEVQGVRSGVFRDAFSTHKKQ